MSGASVRVGPGRNVAAAAAWDAGEEGTQNGPPSASDKAGPPKTAGSCTWSAAKPLLLALPTSEETSPHRQPASSQLRPVKLPHAGRAHPTRPGPQRPRRRMEEAVTRPDQTNEQGTRGPNVRPPLTVRADPSFFSPN